MADVEIAVGLGGEPDRFFYASDYFPQMYEYAVELIKKGLAYVCGLSPGGGGGRG